MTPDQLSQTAAFIAIKFYGLTQIEPYRSWFDEDVLQFYDRLIQFLPKPLKWYYSSLKKKWMRKFFITSEELLLPGDLMHVIMRKYFIHKKINQLLAKNYEQLLVLGAGFDHLSMYCSQQGVPSFEIDAPGMALLKRHFLTTQGYNNPNLNISKGFYSTDTPNLAMNQIRGLEPDKNTIIIAEGFFDYLTVHSTSAILEDLSAFFKNKVSLISTIFALDELSAFHRWVFKTSVRMVNEKIRLGLSKTEFSFLLEEHGFSKQDILTPASMQRKLLVPHNISLPVLKGFYLISSTKHKKHTLWNT